MFMQDGTNFSGTKGSNFDALARGGQNGSLYDFKKTQKTEHVFIVQERYADGLSI